MIRYPASVIRNAKHLIELGEAVLAGKPIERLSIDPVFDMRSWVPIDADMKLFSKTCSTYRVSRNQQLELPKGTNRMTPQRAAELLPVFKAYAEGKKIQCLCSNSEWDDLDDPRFSEDPSIKYRVKPEPKWRMWKPEEVPVGAMAMAYNELDPNKSAKPDFLILGLSGSMGLLVSRWWPSAPDNPCRETIDQFPGFRRWYWPNDPLKTFPVGVLEEPK